MDMDIRILQENNQEIALISGEELLITDVQSALDLMTDVYYGSGASRIVLERRHIAEDFFDLRTGMAGEILQKFMNYRMKLAVVGDFSGVTSRSLQAFIRESNRGSHIFFVSDQQQALEKLSAS